MAKDDPPSSTSPDLEAQKPAGAPLAKAQPRGDVRPTPEGCFNNLLESLHRYNPGFDEPRVTKAYQFAAKFHEGQTRKSGEPYITHPLTVAAIASTLKLDLNSIIAAILHDTVEDTDCTLADIDKAFGSEVTLLVDGLTKIAKIKFRSKQEKLAENFRKMIIAMSRDLRVILIKLCDRLHNMRTISDLADEKRRRISQETLDIYAPLANRLGVYSIKSELEDLCLRYLKPEVYKGLREKVAQKKSKRQNYIDEVIEILERELRKYGFKNMTVTGRPKHFYSIYKKMMSRTLNFEDIHDLFAFRIIVDTIKDCYEALGVVHAMWKPMPGRFKDYIAIPKPNMYQSLHTTVMRPNGETAEIQIRTREMHQTCEFGVAAHWLYKDGGNPAENKAEGKAATDVDKFSWLRQIMQWQSELSDPNEFLEAVKVDLFDEEIFVFTPKGDVFTLPMRSTALDYAFNVHTDVGLRTVGAKVNGSMVPIKKTLRSGDMVEILTSPNQTPNKDWLSFVVTSKARNRIRSFLRQEERQHAKTLGENLLQQELFKLKQKLDFNDKKVRSKLVKIAKESSFDDTLIAVGFGKINAKDLLLRAFPDWDKQDAPSQQVTTTKPARETYSGVLVSGISDVLVRMGKCCHPVPGEEICGYITRGRQISVHRVDCPRALDLDPLRQIEVSWPATPGSEKVFHRCNLQVITFDGTGILADVTQTISKSGANVYKAEAGTRANLTGVLDFELGVKDVSQLEQIIGQLEKITSVIRVTRNAVMKPSRKLRKRRRR